MAIDPLPERARRRAPPLRLADDAGHPSPAEQSALSVDFAEHSDLVVVALTGALDVLTTPDFRERVRRYDPADVQMVIDLAGVSLLDAAGIGALVSLRSRAHRSGGQLGVVCPSRELGRLLWITGLRSAFVLGDDLAAVRAALPASRKGPGSKP